MVRFVFGWISIETAESTEAAKMTSLGAGGIQDESFSGLCTVARSTETEGRLAATDLGLNMLATRTAAVFEQ